MPNLINALCGAAHGAPVVTEMLVIPVAGEDSMLLNLSGANRLRPWTRTIPVRVLIDTDPVFTQIRHLTDPDRRRDAERHTAFFSFGENIGGASTIPDDGLPWQPTRQPIVLDAWPLRPGPATGPFTTVMQWDSYAPREHGGRRFGMSETLR